MMKILRKIFRFAEAKKSDNIHINRLLRMNKKLMLKQRK